jgi:putative oxidoreductase
MSTYSTPYPEAHGHTHAASGLIALAGRILFALIFIVSAPGNFTATGVDYAASHGVPAAKFLVPLAGVLALVGGLCVAAGFYARFGAWLLVLFLIPVTIMMHNFWAIDDPSMKQDQMIHFMKNIALLGGALGFAYFGAGPMSFDARHPPS